MSSLLRVLLQAGIILTATLRFPLPPRISPYTAVVCWSQVFWQITEDGMKQPKSHYEVLGLTSEASLEQIERAYHQLARRWHPDLAGPEGAAAMRQLNAAVATLRDPARRRAYDTRLQSAHGYDVAYIARVSPSLAAHGGRHCTPFCRPDGDALLITIPPGSRDGGCWRVAGCGSIDRDGVRGDLLVTLQIDPALDLPLSRAPWLQRLLAQVWRLMCE